MGFLSTFVQHFDQPISGPLIFAVLSPNPWFFKHLFSELHTFFQSVRATDSSRISCNL